MNPRAQIACAWGGVACVLLAGIGFFAVTGYVPPPRADLPANELADFYVDNATRIRIGMVICLFAWLGWGTLVAAIATQISRIEGERGVLANLELASGTVGWIFLLFPSLLLEVATFRPDERSAELTQALHDLGWITAFMPAAPFCLMAVTIAIATFKDRDGAVYPRWFGYLNLWSAVLFFPGTLLIFFKSGPLAYHGILVFWIPFFVFGVWILAMAWAVRNAALAIPPQSPTSRGGGGR